MQPSLVGEGHLGLQRSIADRSLGKPPGLVVKLL